MLEKAKRMFMYVLGSAASKSGVFSFISWGSAWEAERPPMVKLGGLDNFGSGGCSVVELKTGPAVKLVTAVMAPTQME